MSRDITLVPLIDQLSNPAVQALVAEAAPQGDD